MEKGLIQLESEIQKENGRLRNISAQCYLIQANMELMKSSCSEITSRITDEMINAYSEALDHVFSKYEEK